MIKKLLGLSVAVLLILYSNIALGNRITEHGIEYWHQADGDLTPDQLISWLNIEPLKFVGSGIERGLDGHPVFYGVFDVATPLGNPLQIVKVRILMYRQIAEDSKYTLVGYTITHSNDSKTAYKYHVGKDKYMLYSYSTQRYVHEENEPELKEEIPIIKPGDNIKI